MAARRQTLAAVGPAPVTAWEMLVAVGRAADTPDVAASRWAKAPGRQVGEEFVVAANPPSLDAAASATPATRPGAARPRASRVAAKAALANQPAGASSAEERLAAGWASWLPVAVAEAAVAEAAVAEQAVAEQAVAATERAEGAERRYATVRMNSFRASLISRLSVQQPLDRLTRVPLATTSQTARRLERVARKKFEKRTRDSALAAASHHLLLSLTTCRTSAKKHRGRASRDDKNGCDDVITPSSTSKSHGGWWAAGREYRFRRPRCEISRGKPRHRRISPRQPLRVS